MTDTDHLPECDTPHNGLLPCICESLRACEQRVLRDVDDVWVTQHDDHITWEWKGDTGYALVQREVLELLLARCNEPTYAAGVQAARDAVAAVPPIDQWVDDNGLVSLVYDKGEALAAIDALRGDA